jgi:transcriptional regulator with XRE-family HTH domain
MSTAESRKALGDFLRAHRERLDPPAAFLRRRRTPGWRREELAEACGVSSTWITWLEQGRDVSASPKALMRLADTLRLIPAERAYLFELAGKRDPAAPPPAGHALPASILTLPEKLTIPAYVLDHTWTALAWNAAAARLFAGWLTGKHDRNLLRFVFLSPAAPRLIAGWEDRARRVVAEFRTDFSRHLRDASMQALVDELIAGSAAFRLHWQEQAVLDREGGERRFHRPPRRFYQSTLTFTSHPDLKLVGLTPLTD